MDTQQIVGDPAVEPIAGAAAGGILLRLGGSRYAVAMADVAEVAGVPAVTRMPGTPGWLSGVANWRGRILPVLDLRPLLGAPTVPLATSARLVVLTRGDVVVGVLAEAVPGVHDGTLDDAAPAPADRVRRRGLPGLRPGDRPARADRRARRRSRPGAARPGRPPPPRLTRHRRTASAAVPPSGLQNRLLAPDEARETALPSYRRAGSACPEDSVDFWKRLNGASTLTLAADPGHGRRRGRAGPRRRRLDYAFAAVAPVARRRTASAPAGLAALTLYGERLVGDHTLVERYRAGLVVANVVWIAGLVCRDRRPVAARTGL